MDVSSLSLHLHDMSFFDDEERVRAWHTARTPVTSGTALHYAVSRFSHTEEDEAFLSRLCNEYPHLLSAEDAAGRTPLHYACAHADTRACRALIRAMVSRDVHLNVGRKEPQTMMKAFACSSARDKYAPHQEVVDMIVSAAPDEDLDVCIDELRTFADAHPLLSLAQDCRDVLLAIDRARAACRPRGAAS